MPPAEPVPAVADPAPEPVVAPAAPEPVAVRLGFDDGSEVDLPTTDPRAVALRAVADLLVQDPAAAADNNSAAAPTGRSRTPLRRIG